MKLILSNVAKNYADRRVLIDCSYSFDRKGIYVLTGANGCGKSTLLRICALLEEPGNGNVAYFSGTDPVKNTIELRRRMTLLLPRVGLFNTTVFNNAAYGLVVRGAGNRDLHKKTLECLTLVGLESKHDQNALTLSSGEAQRLGLARALAIDPEFLFLDEPTASIDEQNTEVIEAIIQAMKREGRTTLIMTTHDRAQAERLADTLLTIRQGAIRELKAV